jgi:hypothetical protein
MASGDTLCRFGPLQNEPPSSNYATIGSRNGHPTLQFDDTTGWAAIFTDIMPQNYSNTTGVTVFINATAVATAGTMGWLIAFERDTGLDLDADGFAADQTVTAVTVDGTSGIIKQTSLAISKGANMNSVVAGDQFRIRITRDVANDTAVGNTEIVGIEIRET